MDRAISSTGPIRNAGTSGPAPSIRRASMLGAGWVAGFAALVALIGSSGGGAKFQGDVLYLVPIAAAAALSIVASRRASPGLRWFWVLLAVSNILWLLGELTWTGYDYLSRSGAPFPSLADVFYLSSYVLVVPAILLGFRQSGGVPRLRAILDGSIVVVAVGYAGFEFLIRPQLSYGPSLATAVGVAYPLLGVLLLMVLISLGFSRYREIPRSMVFVGLAFAASAVTDTAYTYLVVLHPSVSEAWLNVGWQLEAVLLCLAALLVIRAERGEPRAETFHRDYGVWAVIVGLVATLTMAAVDANDGGLSAPAGIITLYAVGAVVLRLHLASRENATAGRELAAALRDLQRAEEGRRKLLAQTVSAQEEERKRIATELHDGPIQHLTALGFRIAALRAQLAGRDITRATETLGKVETWIGQDVRELRRTMSELRPPALEERGLEAALRDHAESMGTRGECTVESGLGERLDPTLETVLYRVGQEALTNVSRHAGAKNVYLSVTERDGSVILEVSDDGKGFDVSGPLEGDDRPHFGLVGMRERVETAGGELSVSSTPGGGTRVRVTLPRSRTAA